MHFSVNHNTVGFEHFALLKADTGEYWIKIKAAVVKRLFCYDLRHVIMNGYKYKSLIVYESKQIPHR